MRTRSAIVTDASVPYDPAIYDRLLLEVLLDLRQLLLLAMGTRTRATILATSIQGSVHPGSSVTVAADEHT